MFGHESFPLKKKPLEGKKQVHKAYEFKNCKAWHKPIENVKVYVILVQLQNASHPSNASHVKPIPLCDH